jgi:hypothetical protein
MACDDECTTRGSISLDLGDGDDLWLLGTVINATAEALRRRSPKYFRGTESGTKLNETTTVATALAIRD